MWLDVMLGRIKLFTIYFDFPSVGISLGKLDAMAILDLLVIYNFLIIRII